MTLSTRFLAAAVAFAFALGMFAWGSAYADETLPAEEQAQQALKANRAALADTPTGTNTQLEIGRSIETEEAIEAKTEDETGIPSEAISVAEEPNTNATWAASTWVRLQGNTALDTMVRVCQHGWKSSDVVVVTSMDGYWDALSASSLAGKYKAPVLMTSPTGLSAQTKAEITRLGASHAIIVGGTNAVSSKVENQIKPLLKGAKRIDRPWGSNAANTAVMVADALGDTMSNTCIIATSNGYWDALSAAPYSYATGSPVYLTDSNGAISELVLAAIEREQFSRALIVGGNKAVKATTEQTLANIGIGDIKRFDGENAYDTSYKFATWAISQGSSANRMGVATASGHWDALAGAALCGKNGSVLVLADDGFTANSRIAGANKSQISRGYIYGGTAAVGKKAQAAFERAA